MPPQQSSLRISVVTPTYRRPQEIAPLLENLNQQLLPPFELVLVDGSPENERETEEIADKYRREGTLKYQLVYLRSEKGIARQRNRGIEAARGGLVCFLDDDVRLEPDLFQRVAEVFFRDTENKIGGVCPYITNQHLDPETSPRWRLYRKLKLFSTYEPGRYDRETGYPINRYLRKPHSELVEIDFCGTSCVVYRKEVLDEVKFHPFFFDGYSLIEDAHLALRVSRKWKLLEAGFARCRHLHGTGGRPNKRKHAYMTAVNYKFVFVDLYGPLTFRQKWRFYKVQLVQLASFVGVFLRRPNGSNWGQVAGKVHGILKSFSI